MRDDGKKTTKVDQLAFIELDILDLMWNFAQFKRTGSKSCFFFFLMVAKVYLNAWLKHLSKDGLLERNWRYLIPLGLVLMKRF